jgi:hypothetical protein
MVGGQSGQKDPETQFQSISGYGGSGLLSYQNRRLILGGLQFQTMPGKNFMTSYLNGKKLDVMVCTSHSSYNGTQNRIAV